MKYIYIINAMNAFNNLLCVQIVHVVICICFIKMHGMPTINK